MLRRIIALGQLIRLEPFDGSTLEGRSKERYRRVGLTVLSAIASKGVTLLTTLVSVPLTLDYLGKERYGLWMTISSAIALLAFADLGMGNGLLNAISEANGKDDRAMAKRFVSSGFFILTGVAIGLLGVLAVCYSYIPWSRIVNATSELAREEAGPASAVFIVCVILNIPAGVVQRVQMGYQEGFQSNLWQAGGAILGLISVLGMIHFHKGLPYLVLAMSGGPILVTIANWIFVFGRSRPWLLPRWQQFDWICSRKIATTGSIFVLLQTMAVLAATSDNIVIAQFLGAAAVSDYAVAQKLFSITMISQVFVAPLWPAFGEAMARSDYHWAERTLNRALIASLGSCALVAGVLLIFSDNIVTAWVGASLVPDTSLVAGFALLSLLGSYGGVMSTYFSAGSLVKRQALFYTVAAISSIALKFYLVRDYGVAGVVWATVIGFGLFYTVPAWVSSRRTFVMTRV